MISMIRILVTGSRTWKNWKNIREVFQTLSDKFGSENITIVEGGQVSTDTNGNKYGADYIAGELSKEFGFGLEVYPAEWKKHGKSAGPIRNQEMLRTCKPENDYVVAFRLDGETASPGTTHMVNISMKAGFKVLLIERFSYTEVVEATWLLSRVFG